MDRRRLAQDTFISTRPPVGGKKVRRKKGVAPKKKKSAFKKRPARAGKIVFDTAMARRARLQELSTAQLLRGAENIAANEVGRQDGGIFAGRQQAPIQVNLGQLGQVDDRLAEVQRRMRVANLVNPDNPRPRQDFEDRVLQILRRNVGEVRDVEQAAGVGDIPQPPPQEVAAPIVDIEPEVEFRGAAGEAASIIAEASAAPTFSSSEEVEEALPRGQGGEGFVIPDEPTRERSGGLQRDVRVVDYAAQQDSDSGDSEYRPNLRDRDDLLRDFLADAADRPPAPLSEISSVPSGPPLSTIEGGGFDPTFDDPEEPFGADQPFRVGQRRGGIEPPPEGISGRPVYSNPAFEEEQQRVERGRLRSIGNVASRAGSRVAQLFSRSRGTEEGPEGAFFVESPFGEGEIVGGGGGGLRINPLEAQGAVFGSRAIPNPASSDVASSIGFEDSGDLTFID